MTSLTHCLFILAAVLYVDHANNIHMTPNVTDSPSELIQHPQHSTNAWGGLAIATGTVMKPEKCFAYFMTYPVVRGHHIFTGPIQSHPTGR